MDINELILSDEAVTGIESGAWVGEIPGMPDLRLKVLGSSSKAHAKAMQAKMEAYRKKNKGKPISDEQTAQVIREVLSETTLIDWEGLTQDGKPLKFDRALAKKWLTSRNGKRLADATYWCAQRLEEDAGAYVEEVTKN